MPKYIGPKGNEGIIVEGVKKKPWEWQGEDIVRNLAKFPAFAKYFDSKSDAKADEKNKK